MFANIWMTFVQSPLRICMRNPDHKFQEGIKIYLRYARCDCLYLLLLLLVFSLSEFIVYINTQWIHSYLKTYGMLSIAAEI